MSQHLAHFRLLVGIEITLDILIQLQEKHMLEQEKMELMEEMVEALVSLVRMLELQKAEKE